MSVFNNVVQKMREGGRPLVKTAAKKVVAPKKPIADVKPTRAEAKKKNDKATGGES